jgi:hypothetical protein
MIGMQSLRVQAVAVIHDVPAVVRLRLATRAAPKERAMATMVMVLVVEWR